VKLVGANFFWLASRNGGKSIQSPTQISSPFFQGPVPSGRSEESDIGLGCRHYAPWEDLKEVGGIGSPSQILQTSIAFRGI
jgi:hypothetical protein